LRLVPDESAGQPLVWRLRAVIAAEDEQIAVLQAQVETVLSRLEAAAERERRLELRVAELGRRLSMDSSDSGIPSSKEGIGAKAERKAREKKGRQESERERSKDRGKCGQPGRQGKGLKHDPDPGDSRTAEPPAECRSCHGSLDGADAVEPRWAQVIDIEVLRKVTEVLLPGLGLACGGCGTVTYAPPPIEDAKQVFGTGQARNRTAAAVERTVPFQIACQAAAVTWYAAAGHDPAGLHERRSLASWYTSKAEPATAGMAAKLRRVIIAARFKASRPDQPTREELHAIRLAWEDASPLAA
jgi:hypothetical protein